MTVRQEVAAGIAAAFPAVAVYDYEPDVLRLPAVVVGAAGTYMEPDTACLRQYNLEIAVVMADADERDGPVACEQMIEEVIDVVESLDSATWINATGPTRAEIGGQSVITATLNIRAWRS
jgi:hypothetical protein